MQLFHLHTHTHARALAHSFFQICFNINLQYIPSLPRCLLPSGFKAVIPYDFLISFMPGTCSAHIITFCFTVRYNAEDTGEIHYYVGNTTTSPVTRRAVILSVSLRIQETDLKLSWLLSFKICIAAGNLLYPARRFLQVNFV